MTAVRLSKELSKEVLHVVLSIEPTVQQKQSDMSMLHLLSYLALSERTKKPWHLVWPPFGAGQEERYAQ